MAKHKKPSKTKGVRHNWDRPPQPVCSWNPLRATIPKPVAKVRSGVFSVVREQNMTCAKIENEPAAGLPCSRGVGAPRFSSFSGSLPTTAAASGPTWVRPFTPLRRRRHPSRFAFGDVGRGNGVPPSSWKPRRSGHQLPIPRCPIGGASQDAVTVCIQPSALGQVIRPPAHPPALCRSGDRSCGFEHGLP